MPDVLIVADSIRSPELRHEVPLAIRMPSSTWSEDGVKHVVAPSVELVRLPAVAPEIVGHPLEEFGSDELFGGGSLEQSRWSCCCARAARSASSGRRAREFPAAGRTDPARERHRGRRRQRALRRAPPLKNDAELGGIRRAQRAAEAGMAAGRELLRRAERNGDGLVVDGEPLTCELIKLHSRASLRRARRLGGGGVHRLPRRADRVGHDMGSGRIAPGDVVLFDFFPRDRESACFADMTRTFVVGRRAG